MFTSDFVKRFLKAGYWLNLAFQNLFTKYILGPKRIIKNGYSSQLS
jgi:hypothetical protein